MIVTLRPLRLHWIQGALDDPNDLCAHGGVEFQIGDEVLIDAGGKDFTVSAAALYLLRTLSVSHTSTTPVGDHLFPCCGFAMWDIAENEDVTLCGCPNGEDFEVLHQTGRDTIIILASNRRAWEIELSDWRTAVLGFADAVSSFYSSCSPKRVCDDDRAGFSKFCAEWARRRGQKFGGAI